MPPELRSNKELGILPTDGGMQVEIILEREDDDSLQTGQNLILQLIYIHTGFQYFMNLLKILKHNFYEEMKWLMKEDGYNLSYRSYITGFFMSLPSGSFQGF
jgi:hypothetical protein